LQHLLTLTLLGLFWLRSSVVSVLISLISDIPVFYREMIILIFETGMMR